MSGKHYSDKQKKKILEDVMKRLPERESLRSVARSHKVPASSILNWIEEQGLNEQYARVRELRADMFFEKIHEITEGVSKGRIDPNAGRVSIDAYKWMLGRMNPKKYSDRKDINVNVSGHVEMVEFVNKLSNSIDVTPERPELASDIKRPKKHK